MKCDRRYFSGHFFIVKRKKAIQPQEKQDGKVKNIIRLKMAAATENDDPDRKG